VIAELNRVVEAVEEHLTTEAGDLDVAALARSLATTEHHLRRMFAALAGMPLSAYVRARRMTVAAGALMADRDTLLEIAVRHGYGSTEAFARAFRAVHGAGPSDVRRDGGPLRTQQRLRFTLGLTGEHPMDTRIVELDGLRLVGHAARVPLIYEGVNPHIAEHIASLAPEQHQRLKALADTEPAGLLAVTDDAEQDAPEGSMLTYLHGVAIAGAAPEDLDVIDVGGGAWAVFRTSGDFPRLLQETWAATATQWFPSNPWRLRPGPSIVATLEMNEEQTAATTELWLPVEPRD
jgi:AraC family transcriptional regulator